MKVPPLSPICCIYVCVWGSECVLGSEERIYSYTIITTNSAESVSFLHDRMPVILDPETKEFKKWLDPNQGWSMELANMLKPYEGELQWYPHSCNNTVS